MEDNKDLKDDLVDYKEETDSIEEENELEVKEETKEETKVESKEEAKEEVKEEPKKAKKEKKVKEKKVKEEKKPKEKKVIDTQMIKNPTRNYLFWIKLIGGVILIAFGIALIFPAGHAFGEKIIAGITGGVIFVYGIFRVIPLVKTLNSGWAKFLNILEVIFDLAAGVVLVLGGFDFSEEPSALTKFLIGDGSSEGYYRIIVGAVLYLRAVIYFISTIRFGEKSDWQQLLVHICLITLGTVMFCRPELNTDTLCYVLLALSLLCGVVLTVEGGYNYFNYRKKVKEISDAKEKEKEEAKEDSKDAPTDGDIVPLTDEDKDNDSAYAN